MIPHGTSLASSIWDCEHAPVTANGAAFNLRTHSATTSSRCMFKRGLKRSQSEWLPDMITRGNPVASCRLTPLAERSNEVEGIRSQRKSRTVEQEGKKTPLKSTMLYCTVAASCSCSSGKKRVLCMTSTMAKYERLDPCVNNIS